MMKFNKKRVAPKRPKNFLFAVISCLLLALAFSAQSVFAKEAPTPPKVASDLTYHSGTDIELVDDSAATKDGITWEYAVTSQNATQAPEYGWSTEKPKRNISDWKVWYRTAGNEQYEALSGSFEAKIEASFPIDSWPTINDDLTYTGESQNLIAADSGFVIDGSFRFCVTSKDVTITSANFKNYAWLTNAEATTAGDYKVWVLLTYDGVYFDEDGYWKGGNEPGVYGYLPVTIHYDGPRPKLYIYIHSINS